MDTFVFKRYEYKYKINKEVYKNILDDLKNYLTKDKYHFCTIQSLYFDTSNFRLIRKSIEKPMYKEKLRLRCYGINKDDGEVFFEIKKKYDGIVYKRRIKIKESLCYDFFNKEYSNQIAKEISYFNTYYGEIKPRMLIIYDRDSYIDKESDLRLTFDYNMRYRLNDLNLSTSLEGKFITNSDDIIMEVKSSTSIPIWLVRILSKYKIYKTSFSKYKEAYIKEILNNK